MLNGLDLFSGIGGVSLALDGIVRTVAYCEKDRYAQSVLLSRMAEGKLPLAPIWDDVTTLTDMELCPLVVDIITGGFPCQDVSVAGKRKGLAGERSGLFYEIVRLTDELRPAFVFLENVPAITKRGGLEVINEFTKRGYRSAWTCVSAQAVGAPHKRERWFMLATLCDVGDTKHTRWLTTSECGSDGASIKDSPAWTEAACKPAGADTREDALQQTVWNAESDGVQGHGASGEQESHPFFNQGVPLRSSETDNWWGVEPRICNISYGVFAEMDGKKPHGIMGNKGVQSATKTKDAFKTLSALQLYNGAEPLREETGRLQALSDPLILQQGLYGASLYQRRCDKVCNSKTHPPSSETVLYGLQQYRKLRESSYRRELEKQRTFQFDDALQFLSHHFASQAGRYFKFSSETPLLCLQQSILQKGALQHPFNSFEEAWESLPSAWQDWHILAVLFGQWWQEWPQVERTVSTSVLQRVDRIKCLGNSVVPAQVRLAFEFLTKELFCD